MNKNFIYILLTVPHIAFSMDWTAGFLGIASGYSPGSPSSLPTSQLPTSQPGHHIPLPVAPSLPIVVQDQNNNNNKEITNPYHIINSLRSTLFLKRLEERLSDDSEITLDLKEMCDATAKFKEDLAKYVPHLKGPHFYILQNHTFELQTALGKDGVVTHQPSLQDIEKTIDRYLENPERQQETLEYSFYLYPNNLQAPLTLSYLNFFSATHEYIKALQKLQPVDIAASLSKTGNILDTYFETLKQQDLPNVVLTGNSKLATFARLCLSKFSLPSPDSGMFQFDTQNAKEILEKWKTLMPKHVGIETAWGRRTDSNYKCQQEDRAAFYEGKTFDCVAVFDGHGGFQAAHYCSKFLINDIIQQEGFEPALLSGNMEQIGLYVQKAFAKCNEDLEKQGIVAGTTVLLSFLPYNATHGFMVQLGDGEGYVINNNAGGYTSITPELHNTFNPSEVARIKKEHGDTAISHGANNLEQAVRVGGKVLITRALGNKPEIKKLLSITPTISAFPLLKGDILIIGSDGVFEKENKFNVIGTVNHYKNRYAGEIAVNALNQIKPYANDNKSLIVVKLDRYVSQS